MYRLLELQNILPIYFQNIFRIICILLLLYQSTIFFYLSVICLSILSETFNKDFIIIIYTIFHANDTTWTLYLPYSSPIFHTLIMLTVSLLYRSSMAGARMVCMVHLLYSSIKPEYSYPMLDVFMVLTTSYSHHMHVVLTVSTILCIFRIHRLYLTLSSC